MKFFSTRPRVKDLQAFIAFYDQYTPELWALILSANLPADEAKAILSNTLIKAWQQSDRQSTVDDHSFDWLVGLAQAEVLPTSVWQIVQ